MKFNSRTLTALFMVAPVVLMGASGSAKADAWFVLGQAKINTADPSATITSQGSRWEKDIKKVKLSVQGASVDITKVVLHWDNRRDDTITDIGVAKSGGQTAWKDAPGFKSRLTSVTVQYTILNGAKTATIKVWGYD